MGKTGGGRGTNQYKIKGVSVDAYKGGGGVPTGGTPPGESEQPSTTMFDALNQTYGATPVDEEARQDLLPQHASVQTMDELNTLESTNIAHGLFWVREQGFSTDDLLDQLTLRDIHKHMFDEVWAWAGRIRTREMTIGVDPYKIQQQWLEDLDDARWHIENQTWTPATTVLRLHHRTMYVHPFVNGNGRFARHMADELIASLGLPDDALDWGNHLGLNNKAKRRAYLDALRALDMNPRNIQPLVDFALDPTTEDTWAD